MHLKLRQLQAFRAIMDTGTVSAAAARLNRTQPAVSVALSNLEQEVGFALFDRSKGRLMPTMQAEMLYEEIEQGLLGLERIKSRALEISQGVAGRIRIAADGAPSINFLPRVIADFVAAREGVNIELQTRSSKRIIARVGSHQFDIGIVEMPVHWPGVAVEPFSQACVCIMPETHALAGKRVITPADLDNEPLVYISESHPVSMQLEEAFANSGSRMNTRIRGYYFATCRNLVRHGAGVAIVDAMNGDEALGGGIVARRFEPTIRYDMALIYPSQRELSPVAQAFIDAIRTALGPYQMA